MRRLFSFGVKLFFSLIFTFALIEVGLRLFPPVIPLDLLLLFNEQPRTQIATSQGLPTKNLNTIALERDDGGPELRIYKPFTKLTWTIKETGDIYRATMDENGFCNPPQSYNLPKIDLITLGDSFTACHAVPMEQTWTSQLAALTRLPTYNLGRIGIGIHEYLQIFKAFGVQKKPKIVLMNIYQGNDIRDAIYFYEYRLKSSTTEAPTETTVDWLDSDVVTNNWLARHSYSYNLLLSYVIYGRDNFFQPVGSRPESVNFKYSLIFPDGVSVPFNPENVDKDEVRTAKKLARMEIAPAVFESIERALSEFVGLSKQYNFTPIIVYTPSAYTAYADDVVFADPNLKGLLLSFSHEQRQFLVAQSKKLGFPFIDLTPALQIAAQSNGSDNLLYYQRDLHLTPLGHTVVARVIYENLRAMQLIDDNARVIIPNAQ